jgi:hypothetical protein
MSGMGIQAAVRTVGHFTKTGLKTKNEKKQEVVKITKIKWNHWSVSTARHPEAGIFSVP